MEENGCNQSVYNTEIWRKKDMKTIKHIVGAVNVSAEVRTENLQKSLTAAFGC
jgi:hypothetical protein